MSPRNNYLPILAAVLIVISPLPTKISAEETSSARNNVFIGFYQDHISGIDGDRCPMHPSCSEYTSRAIKKHGPVLGWIMACDRLLRCGRDEVKISPTVRIKTDAYVYDPVTANDFWWFTPPNDKTPEQPFK